ncbi:MAG: hypothetical protein R2789_14470 [Microthrixaceae bacterium]
MGLVTVVIPPGSSPLKTFVSRGFVNVSTVDRLAFDGYPLPPHLWATAALVPTRRSSRDTMSPGSVAMWRIR